MKKNCLVILTILSCLCASHAQGLSFDDNVKMAQIDSVMSVIDRREVALNDVKKDKAKVDSLNALAEDYAVLANLWEDRYKDEANVADKYRALYNTAAKSNRFGTQDKPNKNVIRTWATTQEKSIQRISRPK